MKTLLRRRRGSAAKVLSDNEIAAADAWQRAERGQEFLDDHYPGWHNLPAFDDVSTLRIHCQNGCVLAKLHGDYTKGFRVLGLTNSRATALGFFVDADQDPVGVVYQDLTWAHRNLIQLRRQGVISGGPSLN